MKKKVLLLHCPGDRVYLHDLYCSYSTKANYYWTPSDLILLSGILRDFPLLVIDAIAENISASECERKILEYAPDLILFVTGSATWENDIAFLKSIKRIHPALIVGTSSLFLFEAEHFLKTTPVVDALVLNIASSEIVDFIQGQEKEFHFLALRKGDVIIVPSSDLRKEQDFQIPIPRHDLFKFHLNRSPLAKRIPFALVITSLGCPYSCKFCVSGSVDYQYRNIDNVIQELKLLDSLGVKELMFNDSTFTVSKKRVIELCQKMEENNLAFTWVCNAHVATVSEELMAAMSRAGCHTVMMGVESGTNEILETCAKQTDRERIKAAFKTCKKHKIKTLAYFIIGLPGETRESVRETIRFAKELDCDFASFTVLTPDIGSQLRHEAITKGRLDEKTKAFDSTAFPIFTAGDLTKEEIWKLRQKAVRGFYLRPGYLLKKLMGIRSLKDLAFLVNQALSMFMK